MESKCGLLLPSPKGRPGVALVTLEPTLLTVNLSIPLSLQLLLQERVSELRAACRRNGVFVQATIRAFLIGAENVPTIYDKGRMINFSLQIPQGKSYQNKAVPRAVLLPNI